MPKLWSVPSSAKWFVNYFLLSGISSKKTCKPTKPGDNSTYRRLYHTKCLLLLMANKQHLAVVFLWSLRLVVGRLPNCLHSVCEKSLVNHQFCSLDVQIYQNPCVATWTLNDLFAMLFHLSVCQVLFPRCLRAAALPHTRWLTSQVSPCHVQGVGFG